ncbi:MAG: TolC family outer membrane protein [Chromatiales bacterium]|nr:TolC family outer membrane protein [Chromatiales bacterium]
MTSRSLLVPVLALLVASPLGANTLLDIYEKALLSDPQIREAEANRQAAQESRPIARGSLLPQLTARAGISKSASEGSRDFLAFDEATQQPITRTTRFNERGDATNWTLELRQTLFRWDQWVRLNQAGKEAAQADVDYQAAEQALILRVAETYFNVLAAADTLTSELATKESIERQLEQAQRRFEVGLIAITDVQEAQAAFDQAVAAEILARRVLANQREALREIIDEFPPELAAPAFEIPLVAPEPADENQWVDTAMRQNRALISSQIAAEIAKDNVRIARSGHYPTLDFVATRSDVDAEGRRTTDGLTAPSDFNTQQDQIGLQFSVPLFSGGTISARERQAAQQHRAARERLERTARETQRQTRDAYLGVISEISRVQALRQAVESARTALQATQAGFDVGTRTTVDVLDARRTLQVAETNYLRSRYDYLLNGLRLKQAAGVLTVDDLADVNELLQFEDPLPDSRM